MKMNLLRNEKGIALVMVLILSLIALAVVSTLLYLVLQGTKSSTYFKTYESTLDAGHGGAEIVASLIFNRGNLDIPGLGPLLLSHKTPVEPCVCGFDADPYDEDYPLPSPDTCLCRKLCMPAYKSDGTYSWGASGTGACDSNGASMDPLDNPDVQFSLAGVSTSYQVSAKIIDTTVGVTDLSGEQLSCGTGSAYPCEGFHGMPTPYLYRIEVNSQDATATNARERSRLSILYAY